MTPPIPARIPCISLHQPYAELVVAGIKTIETRTWAWPYEPGWLAIHAAKRFRNGALLWLMENRIDAARDVRVLEPTVSGVIGMVYVTGCRPLVPADEQAACFYSPNLWAWTLEHPTRFAHPIAMRGPQKIVYLIRDQVEQASTG